MRASTLSPQQSVALKDSTLHTYNFEQWYWLGDPGWIHVVTWSLLCLNCVPEINRLNSVKSPKRKSLIFFFHILYLPRQCKVSQSFLTLEFKSTQRKILSFSEVYSEVVKGFLKKYHRNRPRVSKWVKIVYSLHNIKSFENQIQTSKTFSMPKIADFKVAVIL